MSPLDSDRCRTLAELLLERTPLQQELGAWLKGCADFRSFRAKLVLSAPQGSGLDAVAELWKAAVPSLDRFEGRRTRGTVTSEDVLDRLEGIERRLASLQQANDGLRGALADLRSFVGPFGVPLPDGALLVHSLYGLKYLIDPSDDIMAPQLVVHRQWEAELSRFMWNSVDRDTVFVDVGANFGYFSCMVAARIGLGGSGRVVAVEPNPKMLDLLRRNIAINWSIAPVEVHACAIADTAGEMMFNVPAGRAANAGLVANDAPASGSDTRLTVRTATIDEVLAGRPADLMKIDVEGYEALVLQHLAAALKRSPGMHIIMEWSPEQMISAGSSPQEVIGLIRELGLSAYRVPHSRHADAAILAGLALPLEDLSALAYDNILLKRSH